MKKIKRALAAGLVLIMALAVTACHPKNEIAVTIGDIEFTSAYYMCALINADSEAKAKVNEAKAADENATDTETDYYSEKIDKKDFVDWVKDAAIQNLKKIAAYKTLCKTAKLELSEEEISNAEYYASYYWSSYGYSAYFEPNGVGAATYTSFMKDSYYSNLYFEHLYGADGEKAIASDKVIETIYGNFIIADMLQVTYSEETDAEKAELKTKIQKYETALKNGTMTFEQVYNEYNNVSEEDQKENETTESKEPQPKDKYASILGAKDTVYESEHYDTVKALKTGEVKLIELEDNTGMILFVKQDIKADEYYKENLDLTARHIIADEEYEKFIDEYAAKLNVKLNKYAVNQFKVKKIKEPEAAA